MNWLASYVIVNDLALLFCAIAMIRLWIAEKKKKSFVLFMSMSFFTLSVVSDVVLVFNIFENELFFYAKMLLWFISSILFFLYGSLILLRKSDNISFLIVLYWVAPFTLAYFMSFKITLELVLVWYLFLFIVPTQFFLIFFYNHLYLALNKRRVFAISLSWTISTSFLIFTLIGYRFVGELLDVWLIINIVNSVLLTIGIYHLISEEIKIITEVEQDIDVHVPEELLDFISEHFEKEKAQQLISKTMKKLDIQHIKLASDVQLKQFVDIVVDEIYSPIFSASRRGILKSKILTIFGLDVSDPVYQSDHGRAPRWN